MLRDHKGTFIRLSSMNRRSFLRSSIGGLGALLLAGVAYGQAGPVVKIAASRNAAAPVWNLGNVSERFGFKVEMSVLFTYAEQARAAQTGQTNTATCGIDTMATVADQGISNLRYIAADQYGGQNLVMKTGVNPSKWAELEGKAIGVVPGTWARVLFLVAAKEGGADIGKIRLTNVSVGATAQEALRRGDVEGVVLFTPQCDQLVASGIGHYPEKFDIGASSIGCANSGLLATTELLSDRTLATNVMKAYLASMEDIRDPAVFTKLVTNLTGISAEAAALSFRDQVFSEKIDPNAIKAAAKLGSQFGFTKTDTSGKVESFVDFGPLMAASGRSREALTGPPKEALVLIRR
jgi:ABC-type nitrate/sulfonate/bicarbonate transport system substrate-binding protein